MGLAQDLTAVNRFDRILHDVHRTECRLAASKVGGSVHRKTGKISATLAQSNLASCCEPSNDRTWPLIEKHFWN